MPGDLLIARNPEEYSKLPYPVRVPIGDGIVLKSRKAWPQATAEFEDTSRRPRLRQLRTLRSSSARRHRSGD